MTETTTHLDSFSGLSQKLRLKCQACGSKRNYEVGTIFWTQDEASKAIRYTFTRYFRCRGCDSPGPWEPAEGYKLQLRIFCAIEAKIDDERLVHGFTQLFDGTSHQSPAMAEKHLLDLLIEEPKSAFLHTRLGNLFRGAGERARSVEWYEKAIALDPGDLEARHHLHEFAVESDNFTAALNHAAALAEHLLAGRRCEKKGLGEGIAFALAESLFRYPVAIQREFLNSPKENPNPRGTAFLRFLFQQTGNRKTVEQAAKSLLAGKPEWDSEKMSPVDTEPEPTDPENLPDLHPSLIEAAAEKNLRLAKLTLAFGVDNRKKVQIPNRHSLPIGDRLEHVAFWTVPSLQNLFRGDARPPADLDRVPKDYIPYFTFVGSRILNFFIIDGPKTDQEMEKVFNALRRRPDGKSLNLLHDAIWQIAALLLGTFPLSEAQFVAIFTQLEKSARRHAKAPVSRNYADLLRKTFE